MDGFVTVGAKKKRIRISYNAPVVLTFVAVCFFVTVLGLMTDGESTALLFCARDRSFLDPMLYVGLFSHVFGHVDVAHFANNAMFLLLVGPMLEEKYGSRAVLKLIFVTAFVEGVVHCLFVPGSSLCGASGVVFSFITLASFASVREGAIPLSAVLVVGFFLGNEICSGIIASDNISNLTHVIGGLVGAVAGFVFNRRPSSLRGA